MDQRKKCADICDVAQVTDIPYSRKGWRGIYFGELAISVYTAKE